MKLRSQAFQGTNLAARAVGISGIHAGEDVKESAHALNRGCIEIVLAVKIARMSRIKSE